MAILKNTTVTGTGHLLPSSGTTSQRPTIYTSIIQWTNTGSQAYSILAGPTPTLTNTSWTAPTGVTQIEVLVVGGGGGGAGTNNSPGGGGGAGGLIYNSSFSVTPGSSYTVTVGAGGSAGIASPTVTDHGGTGSNSVFGSLTAYGGGGGARDNTTAPAGTYGSGGGGSLSGLGASGTSGQGFSGGNGNYYNSGQASGGGGGAGGPGANSYAVNGTTGYGGAGGPGLAFDISGTMTYYAGGGGGSGWASPASGGQGGGGRGGYGTNGTAGTASTGGGGGGGGGAYNAANTTGGAGGSGVVIIRYSVLSDNTDTRGLIRYNTDLRDYEVYEGVARGWVSQDYSRNFGGHNLHNYSEQLGTNYWTSLSGAMTVTANAARAPDGTLTADALVPSNANTSHYLYSADVYTKTANAPQTTSLYAKRVNYDYITIQGSDNTSSSGIQQGFNLATGQIGTTTVQGSGVLISASMIDVGNGWYRCVLVAKSPGTSARTAIGVGGNGTLSNAGDGSSYNLIWGVQVEDAVTSPGPYTRTESTFSPVPQTIGNYRVHTYTTTGTSSFTPAVSGSVELLVVAGGGAGGQGYGGGAGGGGAGGVIYRENFFVTANTPHIVTVGVGGAAVNSNVVGTRGGNSQFGNLIAVGGGGGTSQQYSTSGGSGGGGGEVGGFLIPGPGTLGQGNQGGYGFATSNNGGAGGGGAGGVGQASNGAPLVGQGGQGLYFAQFSHAGYPAGWFGGGGGASMNTGGVGSQGGLGGGGFGGPGSGGLGTPSSGIANTGGGGGGTHLTGAGTLTGGSGIVIVRYRYD